MRFEARGGPVLVGLNPEERAGHITLPSLSFLTSKLGVMISDGCAKEQLCSSFNYKRTGNEVTVVCHSHLGQGPL